MSNGAIEPLIVAASARVDDQVRLKCLEAGFDHVLQSPLSMEDCYMLIRSVNNNFARAKAQEALLQANLKKACERKARASPTNSKYKSNTSFSQVVQ